MPRHHWWLSLALAGALLVLLALGAKAYRDGGRPRAAAPPRVERLEVAPDVACWRVEGTWAGCARVWPTMGPLPRPRGEGLQ